MTDNIKIFFFIILMKIYTPLKQTQKASVIFLDTETTGVSNQDRVIEIAAIKCLLNKKTEKYEETEIFETRLNPEREISKNAAKIHHMSNEELQNRPQFHEIFRPFLTFIKGSYLIAHNAPFDRRMINLELIRIKQSKLPNSKWIDSLQLAKLNLKRNKLIKKQYTLENLAKTFGIEIPSNLHNASVDARLLIQVYEKITKKTPTLHKYGFCTKLQKKEKISKKKLQKKQKLKTIVIR